MKKLIAIFLILIISSLSLFTSCKKENEIIPSDASSEITTIETLSDISRNESDDTFTFAFNPYILSSEALKKIGNKDLYVSFVNAILKKEESFSVDDIKDYDSLRFALGELFPLDNLIKNYIYNSEDKKIFITYNYLQTHESKIENFKTALQSLFSECVNSTDSDEIAAMQLYKWIGKNIKISNESKLDTSSDNSSSGSENENTSGIYNALINKVGTQQSVSSLYTFLLAQLGIKSKVVNAWDNKNNYRVWNMIELKGKWYFCDIAKEIQSTEGEGLSFFCMSKDDLSNYFSSEKIFTGSWEWTTSKLPKAKSNRFENFRTVVNWNIIESRTEIELFTNQYSRFVWTIND